jgi:hypothetical protein
MSVAFRYQAVPVEGELFTRLERDAQFRKVAVTLSHYLGLFRTLELDSAELAEILNEVDPALVEDVRLVLGRARSTIAGIDDRALLCELMDPVLAALEKAIGAEAQRLIYGDAELRAPSGEYDASFGVVTPAMVSKGATLLGLLNPTELLDDTLAIKELRALQELFSTAAARGEALLLCVFT